MDERLQSLQGQLDGLSASQSELQTEVREALNKLVQDEGLTPLEDLQNTSQLPELNNNLASLTYFRAYVEELKTLVEITRSIETSIRSLEDVTTSPEAEVQSAPWIDVITQYSTAAHHQATLISYASAIPTVPQVQQHADHVSQRLQTAVGWIHRTLTQLVASHLQQCGWPPPFTTPSADQPAQQQQEQHEELQWQQHPTQLASLRELLSSLTALQQAQQQHEFAALAAAAEAGTALPTAPLLWAAEALAAPLEEKLAVLFDNGTALGALDRPEWLLDTVVRLTQQQCPGMVEFQEVLCHRGLAACMSFPVEFARAMRQAAVNILVKIKLPELTESADSSRELWLHLLNCLVDFEVKLAPLLGIPVPDKGSLPLTLLAGGALERLCSEATWLERWLDSEQSSMRSQLDEVLYSDSVWEPPAAEVASEDGGDGGYDGAQPVWRQEFYPPQGAEKVALQLQALWTRLGVLPSAHAQAAYIKAVIVDLLKGTYGRMLRILKQAEIFNDLTSADWAPKICACLNAAHYLEHALREAAEQLPVQQRPEPQQQYWQHAGQEQEQQESGMGEATSLLEREATALGQLRREWTLRLGGAVAKHFSRLCPAYKRQLTALASSAEVPGAELTVSIALLQPLEYLSAQMGQLAGSLDSDCFRAIWKLIAVAINRSLFNDVATEARFSPHGAAQFQTDCEALVSVFRAYSAKPQAHFRELLDCCRLLRLTAEQAAGLTAAIGQVSERQEAQLVLAGFGVAHLPVEQAVAVMVQRLELV